MRQSISDNDMQALFEEVALILEGNLSLPMNNNSLLEPSKTST